MVTTSFTMTSLTPPYYDVTNPPLLWRHRPPLQTLPPTNASLTPPYYDVTHSLYKLSPLLWRHWPPPTMTSQTPSTNSPPYYDVTNPPYYDVTDPPYKLTEDDRVLLRVIYPPIYILICRTTTKNQWINEWFIRNSHSTWTFLIARSDKKGSCWMRISYKSFIDSLVLRSCSTDMDVYLASPTGYEPVRENPTRFPRFSTNISVLPSYTPLVVEILMTRHGVFRHGLRKTWLDSLRPARCCRGTRVVRRVGRRFLHKWWIKCFRTKKYIW